MRRSHPRPRNEKDFEVLCLQLLQAHWHCRELHLYAKRGQAQHGVDIIDTSGQEPLRAAQCKLRTEGTRIGPSEIQEEINKAQGFSPPLGTYAIMTTAEVGKDVHDLLIVTNLRHKEEGVFSVEILDWSDIELLLDQYTEVRDWYESGSPRALGGLTAKIEELSEKVDRISPPDRGTDIQDAFHAEIDETRVYLQKRDFQVAKILLQRIRDRSWDQLSERHKFRVLTNLASVAVADANYAEAAELYFRAKECQPTDEAAQINEVRGHLLLGQRRQAFDIARGLWQAFPQSPGALSVYLQSAPESLSVESLEASVPPSLLGKDEVAGSLAWRALSAGETGSAERFLRGATSAGSTLPQMWVELGRVILQSEIEKSRKRFGTQEVSCDPDRVREAQEVLGHALTLARESGTTSEMVEALLNRSHARAILDEEEEAAEDLESARQLAPDDPLVMENYSTWISHRGRSEEAIDHMRRIPPHQVSQRGRMLLGALLIERGEAGDYSSAGDLLGSVAKSAERLPEGFREDCLEIAFQAFAKDGQPAACRALLDQVPEGTISQLALMTFRARCYSIEGNLEEARGCADGALSLKETTTEATFDLRRLAVLLESLGRFDEALPLWQGIADPTVLSSDTRSLLECASRLHRHEVMMAVFRKLREAGQSDRELLEHEITLLEIYDTDEAIRILNDEVAKREEDGALRLRRSWLGLSLDRQDLVDRDRKGVPKWEEVEPSEAIKAVHVLRAIGKTECAAEYAYEVMRRNYSNPDSHRALMVALGPFGPEPQLERPKVVAPDTAVCYREKGDSTLHWIVVEGAVDPQSPFPERELPPNHEICAEMMGKESGESFLLATGMQDRMGEIVSVENKHVHRVQHSMAQWQVLFPKLPDVQVINIGREPEGLEESALDLSVIERSVAERHEDIRRRELVYEEHMIPLHVFGDRLGRTAFDAILHVAHSRDVSVRCCNGTGEEREESGRALRACNRLVLDMSAIGTLFLLDLVHVLGELRTEVVVSRGTVNQLRTMVANTEMLRGGGREAGVLRMGESGLGIVESKAEDIEGYIGSLRTLVEDLERHCRVERCPELAAIEPRRREGLLESLGRYGVETLVLAGTPGSVLWSDDLVQAALGRGEFGGSRVWTQLVIESCADVGEVGMETFLEASAMLDGFGYRFTSHTPDTMLRAARLAEWKVEEWPLQQVMRTFADETIELMQVIGLAAGFLRLAYREPILATRRDNLTVSILEGISKREHGIGGIRVLNGALPAVFGLDVVGLRDASGTIESWMRSTQGRPFGL